MIIYVLIAIVVFLLIYTKRNDIKRYLDKEISEIRNLNDIDDEVEALADYYSAFSTVDLIEMINSGSLKEKELRAVQKVLRDRQVPPPF